MCPPSKEVWWYNRIGGKLDWLCMYVRRSTQPVCITSDIKLYWEWGTSNSPHPNRVQVACVPLPTACWHRHTQDEVPLGLKGWPLTMSRFSVKVREFRGAWFWWWPCQAVSRAKISVLCSPLFSYDVIASNFPLLYSSFHIKVIISVDTLTVPVTQTTKLYQQEKH